jgi:hypothetical protein
MTFADHEPPVEQGGTGGTSSVHGAQGCSTTSEEAWNDCDSQRPHQEACHPSHREKTGVERLQTSFYRAAPRVPPVPPANRKGERLASIRAWLARNGETDPATAETMQKCEDNDEALAHFARRAAEDFVVDDDDRRTCRQCVRLVNRRCGAAADGEIAASWNYEPDPNMLRRCEGYVSNESDHDRRPGRKRWPGLV